MTDATRADHCVIACAEAFRGDGEIMASPFGACPTVGARLARATFEPDLVLTDLIASIKAGDLALGRSLDDATTEGWMPFRRVFDTLAGGRRHVMMGATQIDRYGNQNISCIGDWSQPKVQLIGVRGAPGNTINHTTSYFVQQHSPKGFVEQVDMVSGVGYDRAAALPERTRRDHEIRRVVTNLCVLDFETPDGRMRLRSVHPGVTVDEVVGQTGFELVVPDDVPDTRSPTDDELRLIREVFDPDGQREREVPS